jgi:hypothetical protein
MLNWLFARLVALYLRVGGGRPDRGDVPGWVMITVMTVAIATVLWGLASDTFQRIFNAAFSSVGPK